MRFFTLLLIIIFYSCTNDSLINSEKLNIKKDSLKTTTKDEKFIVNTKKISLHSEASKIVENWQEYQSVKEFIPKFYNTSTKDVLLNSNHFFELTSLLKDSIRVKSFKNPSMKTRLNVLHNQSLRLFDMDSIPSITNKEIIQETNNIVNAFNALNIKINNAVKKDLLKSDLSDFNHLFEMKDTFDIKPLDKQKQKIKARKNNLKNKRIAPLRPYK